MPKLSRESAKVEDYGIVEDRSGEVEGYTINFTTFRQDIDGAPMLKGLPDDRCQCPHWGYVLKGKLTFPTAEGDEVFVAGDAFYLSPGHGFMAEAGTEYVQFSPTKELKETEAVIMKNMQAMQQR